MNVKMCLTGSDGRASPWLDPHVLEACDVGEEVPMSLIRTFIIIS